MNLQASAHDTVVAAVATVERVLAARIARPGGGRVRPGWTRHALDHLRIHDASPTTGEVRLVMTVCVLDTAVDLRALRHDLLSANAAPSPARFIALDGALHVEAVVPAADATPARVDAALDELLRRASSHEAFTLRRRYHVGSVESA